MSGHDRRVAYLSDDWNGTREMGVGRGRMGRITLKMFCTATVAHVCTRCEKWTPKLVTKMLEKSHYEKNERLLLSLEMELRQKDERLHS